MKPGNDNSNNNTFWQRLKVQHRSNKQKGVYGYMIRTAVKIVVIYALILTPFILAGKYLIDFKAIFTYITDHVSDLMVFVIFTISESFMGMILRSFRYLVREIQFSHGIPDTVRSSVVPRRYAVVSYRLRTYKNKEGESSFGACAQ